MSEIKFVSSETFEDEFTKEIVYLELNVPCRVAYTRKLSRNGGEFWSVASIGVTKDGAKVFYPSFMQDSNFLEKDIRDFLDKRKWESRSSLQRPKSESDLPF